MKENQNIVKSKLEQKIIEILSINGLPEELQKEFKKLKKEIPNYFIQKTFLTKEEMKNIVVETTGYAGWTIEVYDFGVNPKAMKNYCDYFGFCEDDFDKSNFTDDCITYVLSRKSNSKYELCGLEIQVQGIEINVVEQSLGASGGGFSCFRKDFKKKMKTHFKQ